MIAPERQRISFRAVNRPGTPGFDPGLQRHHLLPRQLLTRRAFMPMLDALGRTAVDFEDVRCNGLLLPANDRAVLKIGLPLHRGPHRDYNAMVIERVGQIEATWSATRLRARMRTGSCLRTARITAARAAPAAARPAAAAPPQQQGPAWQRLRFQRA